VNTARGFREPQLARGRSEGAATLTSARDPSLRCTEIREALGVGDGSVAKWELLDGSDLGLDLAERHGGKISGQPAVHGRVNR
jgi:hypothetical protein